MKARYCKTIDQLEFVCKDFYYASLIAEILRGVEGFAEGASVQACERSVVVQYKTQGGSGPKVLSNRALCTLKESGVELIRSSFRAMA